MMRKNKLSAIMMVLVLVMAAALTGCSDKKAKEQEIQNKVAAIDTAYEAFTAEADHAKKLEAYKTMVSEDEAYTEKDAVKEKYTAVLADMKKAFTDEYDSTIAENTVDVSKEEDENKVSTYKDNLTKALGTIKADAVCTDEEITAYEASVNAAVKTYDDRVTAIKKAAAEKKAEEEAKAKKESEEAEAAKEKTAKSSGSSSSGKSTSASGSSSSGSSSSGSSASSSSGSSSSGSNSGSSGSYSDNSASDNSGSSTSSSSGSSDASSASGSSSGSESSGGSSGSESGNHTWATGSMTGDDGQEHEFTIKDNILYNDEGKSEDISAWVAH
ncbi:MAG: hypothetical protein ACLTWZ_14040 [Coprococcus sp.]